MELSASVSRLRLASVIQTSLDGLRMPHARLIYPAGIQSFSRRKSATLETLAFRSLSSDGWSDHHTMARGAKKNGLPSHNRGSDRRDHSGEPGTRESASDHDSRRMGSDWGHWPLKRLVAIWNSLPGVAPVEKFTSRQIALERIWRAVEFPTQARRNATAKVGKAKLHFRDGSKAAQAYALLCRPEGVTMCELQMLTGWQRHTVRGFLL